MSNENPYATPVTTDSELYGPIPGGGRGKFVRQVKPLCICMIIQGCLEIGVVLLFALIAAIGPLGNNVNQGRAPMPPESALIAKAVIFTMSGIALVGAIVRIFAAIRGLSFRNYSWGIASHFMGLLQLSTCYCLPTSLGLGIWGLIVYFNSDVKQAFKLRQQGLSSQEIESNFRM